MTSSFERSFRWKDAVSVLGRRNDSAPSGSLFGVPGGGTVKVGEKWEEDGEADGANVM